MAVDAQRARRAAAPHLGAGRVPARGARRGLVAPGRRAGLDGAHAPAGGSGGRGDSAVSACRTGWSPRAARAVAEERGELLDRVDRASLLTGDLWTPDVLLADGAPRPLVTGVLDLDRAEWGDPLADWAVWTARRKPGREGFWGGYGTLPDDEGALEGELAALLAA
ncbi:phosphotransferase [Actinosynnema mirum]|uniref:phosphotransferase n=1 Tax=Actinosynnema mirum TaxID=40567 RepID=UPI000A00B319|nr:phosphotransferase [Actinosynnema mirum]